MSISIKKTSVSVIILTLVYPALTMPARMARHLGAPIWIVGIATATAV
jgi:hypothetical protein